MSAIAQLDRVRVRDVRLGHPSFVAFNDQQPSMNGEPGIIVRHENLRVTVGLRQATPHSEVLLTSTTAVQSLNRTNVVAGYT